MEVGREGTVGQPHKDCRARVLGKVLSQDRDHLILETKPTDQQGKYYPNFPGGTEMGRKGGREGGSLPEPTQLRQACREDQNGTLITMSNSSR